MRRSCSPWPVEQQVCSITDRVTTVRSFPLYRGRRADMTVQLSWQAIIYSLTVALLLPGMDAEMESEILKILEILCRCRVRGN
jgi:hypothetical protein